MTLKQLKALAMVEAALTNAGGDSTKVNVVVDTDLDVLHLDPRFDLAYRPNKSGDFSRRVMVGPYENGEEVEVNGELCKSVDQLTNLFKQKYQGLLAK